MDSKPFLLAPVVQDALKNFFSMVPLQSGQSTVPMEQQPLYINDWFGLRTLDEQGRLNKTVRVHKLRSLIIDAHGVMPLRCTALKNAYSRVAC